MKLFIKPGVPNGASVRNPRVLSMSGKPLSNSHFAMADLETANFSASCSCDKPVFFLASLIF
jgi:hypothetical protein